MEDLKLPWIMRITQVGSVCVVVDVAVSASGLASRSDKPLVASVPSTSAVPGAADLPSFIRKNSANSTGSRVIDARFVVVHAAEVADRCGVWLEAPKLGGKCRSSNSAVNRRGIFSPDLECTPVGGQVRS